MRFIIFGVGAIGGTIAACLARAGHEVAGIARGRQLEAIRRDGLTMKTPQGDSHVRFDCAGRISEIELRPDDVVLLCVKSQHTLAALEDLAAAGLAGQAVVCVQNGVANERLALRYFDNVYGATILMPCDYVEPGTVCAFGTPRLGIIDIGRYPSGTDEQAGRIAEALAAAGFVTDVRERVMASKYGKLFVNLHNIVDAAFTDRKAHDHWAERARAEARAVYAAAGIEWEDVGPDDPRRARFLNFGTIEGIERIGSSSRQSLLRGTGSIETDYLNGEIALLGRLHGVPVPVNAALCRIGRKLAAGILQAGKVTDEDVEAELAAGGHTRLEDVRNKG